MKQEQNKIKYFLYARKSSESEDRQVQSIDDQTKEIKYMPLVGPKDNPAVFFNKDIMAVFKPQLQKFYYNPAKYKTYLEQLGIRYPTLRQHQLDAIQKGANWFRSVRLFVVPTRLGWRSNLFYS